MGDLDRWARDHRHRKKRQQIAAERERRRLNPSVQAVNDAFIDKLIEASPAVRREAQDAVDEYTRRMLRK